MKEPARSGAGGGQNNLRASVANPRFCPNAEDCRTRWLWSEDQPDGATCAHCYQFIPRHVLSRIIAGMLG